jgi:hypothetical protein
VRRELARARRHAHVWGVYQGVQVNARKAAGTYNDTELKKLKKRKAARRRFIRARLQAATVRDRRDARACTSIRVRPGNISESSRAVCAARRT